MSASVHILPHLKQTMNSRIACNAYCCPTCAFSCASYTPLMASNTDVIIVGKISAHRLKLCTFNSHYSFYSLKAKSKQAPFKYPANNEQILCKYQAITKKPPSNYQAKTKQLTSKYQATSHQISSKYQAITKQLPSKYQADAKQLPCKYLATTK